MASNTNLDQILSQHNSITKPQTTNLIAGVFSWMFLALVISAVTSYLFKTSGLISVIIDPITFRPNPLGWIITLLPLGLVLLMSFGYQKLSAFSLAVIFILYSLLMGMSLSTIFLAYTGTSIASTFAITSLTFGIMALVGYTTKTDLTKLGSILMMALIGIIIATLINLFLHSGGLNLIINIIGVIVFTGFTAYDVQNIKTLSQDAEVNGWDIRKTVIMGALRLYLDFVNLFLFLLNFFGRRNN